MELKFLAFFGGTLREMLVFLYTLTSKFLLDFQKGFPGKEVRPAQGLAGNGVLYWLLLITAIIMIMIIILFLVV